MMLFSAINLGCTKNLVDTQYLLGNVFSNQGKEQKMMYSSDPHHKDVKIVFLNTCGFIKSGRDEMFEVVEELLKNNKKIYIVGCGLQYFENLIKNSSNISDDIKFSKEFIEESRSWKRLVINQNVQFLSWDDFSDLSIDQILSGYNSDKFDDFSFPKSPRVYTNLDQGFEYVKIAEGCMNNCSFCIIPKIRGTQKSQSIESILGEVKDLVNQGVKEIILISQDTTRYGVDKYRQPMLLDLLKEIDQLEGDFIYRLLYLYPDIMTFGRFDELKKLSKFVPYFDLPLQHINSDLLKKMGRFSDVEKIKNFLKYIRKSFDESYIRTNFIVGFPGETEKHVDELITFIKEGGIDNIALFEYHDEPLAMSSSLPNKVESSVISKRFDRIKNVVDSVKIEGSHNIDSGYIMSFNKDTVIVRPWLHTPEIDEYITIPFDYIIENISGGENLNIGDLVKYNLK